MLRLTRDDFQNFLLHLRIVSKTAKPAYIGVAAKPGELTFSIIAMRLLGGQKCKIGGKLAAQILENSPTSVRATKRLINGFIREVLDRQIADAVRDNAQVRTTADFREGITSFLEKRKPVWTGK